MPEGFFEFDTVGIIYDELDGFVVVPEYGMLRELFADPSLAEADPYAGDPDSVARELRDFYEACGGFGTGLTGGMRAGAGV